MKKFKKLAIMSMAVITAISAMMNISCLAYSDIDASGYKTEIQKLSDYGVINGYEDGTFRPKDEISRAEICKMLAVATGYNEYKSAPEGIATSYTHRVTGTIEFDTGSMTFAPLTFKDLSDGTWSYPYVQWLNGVAGDVINGFEDNTFRADDSVTVMQLLKMAVCAHGSNGYVKYLDESLGYPQGYLDVAKKYGFTEGADISDINSNATREQAAKIIYNTISIPISWELSYPDIDDEGNMFSHYIKVICNGENHYPFTSLETCLQNKNWTLFSTGTDIDPFDEDNEFNVVGEVTAVDADTVSVDTYMLINYDGSIYKVDNMPKVVLKKDADELNDPNPEYRYIFDVKKENDDWKIERYATAGVKPD